MAIKTNHLAGETILADDRNDENSAIILNQHNIFELFLENFFSAKITPFQGLFFDGFSDETKVDETETDLTAEASSGQAILVVTSTTDFLVGHEIDIFDGTNFEAKIIQTIDSGVQITLTTNLANTYAIGIEIKRSSVDFDTLNKLIKITTSSLANTVIDLEASSNQSLSITDASQTGLDITGDITMELWVNLETIGVNHTLINKAVSGGNQISYIVEARGNNKIQVLWSGNGSTTNVELTDAVVFSSAGVWIHVAVSIDVSAKDCKIYIDGFLVASTLTDNGQTSIFNSTAPFEIGATDNGAAVHADAKIDEVRIWDIVRTGTEILDNFEKQLIGSETNLQAYYRFTNDLLDQTSNNNDLTNNNGAVFNSADTPILTGDPILKSNYRSELQSFQQQMENANLWVVRSFVAQFNLDANISAGATTLTILGDETGTFANGDTIDISTDDNLTRERKTLTAVPTFGGGVTTLTFSATTNAFTTSDFVERVDVIPEISIVDKDASENFEALTFVRSIVDFTNSEVEDEYTFTTGTPNEDVTVKLVLSREDNTLDVFAKRLGVVLTT